jgi:hypothetical protein
MDAIRSPEKTVRLHVATASGTLAQLRHPTCNAASERAANKLETSPLVVKEVIDDPQAHFSRDYKPIPELKFLTSLTLRK